MQGRKFCCIGNEKPQEEVSVHEMDEYDISSNVVIEEEAIIEGKASAQDRLK